jgi:3-hydroxyisobutyrate dehydrogenase-like beta-hydroxyacid dehydrogenase
MGSRVAAGLVAAGYEVRGWDPAVASSISLDEVVASAEVLVTVLPGSAEIATLEGTLSRLSDGALWLDLTSSDPTVVEGIVARTGVLALGAPMGGGPDAADTRTLRFFAGGSAEALGRALPLLQSLGTVDHIGLAVGAGYTAKLLANLLWFGQAVAVTEALLLGKSLGLDPASLRATLASSAGGSVFLDDYAESLLAGDYLETFGIDRVVEELDILVRLAAERRVPFELSELVARTHREALARFGAVDGELLGAKLLEQLGGSTLRSEPIA